MKNKEELEKKLLNKRVITHKEIKSLFGDEANDLVNFTEEKIRNSENSRLIAVVPRQDSSGCFQYLLDSPCELFLFNMSYYPFECQSKAYYFKPSISISLGRFSSPFTFIKGKSVPLGKMWDKLYQGFNYRLHGEIVSSISNGESSRDYYFSGDKECDGDIIDDALELIEKYSLLTNDVGLKKKADEIAKLEGRRDRMIERYNGKINPKVKELRGKLGGLNK